MGSLCHMLRIGHCCCARIWAVCLPCWPWFTYSNDLNENSQYTLFQSFLSNRELSPPGSSGTVQILYLSSTAIWLELQNMCSVLYLPTGSLLSSLWEAVKHYNYYLTYKIYSRPANHRFQRTSNTADWQNMFCFVFRSPHKSVNRILDQKVSIAYQIKLSCLVESTEVHEIFLCNKCSKPYWCGKAEIQLRLGCLWPICMFCGKFSYFKKMFLRNLPLFLRFQGHYWVKLEHPSIMNADLTWMWWYLLLFWYLINHHPYIFNL